MSELKKELVEGGTLFINLISYVDKAENGNYDAARKMKRDLLLFNRRFYKPIYDEVNGIKKTLKLKPKKLSAKKRAHLDNLNKKRK